MSERPPTRIGNLGERFLDDDPQQSSDRDDLAELRGLSDEVDDRPADDPANVGYAGTYEDDVATSGDVDAEGPMDTEFLFPAPSQPLNADEEPGGMYGSVADELLGSPGPDGRDLGDTDNDTEEIAGSLEDRESGNIVELQQPGNVMSSTGMEDQLSTDIPLGGTYGRQEEVIDPDTGELSDYDDA
jgi:hypothetical protein